MAAPRAHLRGIDDQSTRQVQYENPSLAQHTPLLMLMTRRGPVEPTFIGIDEFDTYFDLKSIDENSTWHTHQSELMAIAIKRANATVVIKRIVDETSKSASLCLGVDPRTKKVKSMEIDEMERTYDNSKFVPILQFEAANPGEWGNHLGLQIFVADDKKQKTLGTAIGAVVYEAVVMQEDPISGSERIINNIYGEPSTFFTMKKDAIYNGVDYYFDDVMRRSYIEDERVTRPQYFADFKLHREDISIIASNPDAFWKEDVLTPIKSSDAYCFKRNFTAYAKGGDDGFKHNSSSIIENRLDRQYKYEMACKNWLASIDDTNPIVDMAQYPFSTLWDSGFTKETKEEFKQLFKYRKDVWNAMAATSVNRYYDNDGDTYFDYQPKLKSQEAISLAVYYRSIFSGIPESQTYGTPTVRATLVCQDGVNRNSRYRQRQTINMDLFDKVCKYCGSGEGKWRSEFAFDDKDLNTLENWHDVSMDYMSPPVTDDAWDAGLIYVQTRDTLRKFYPMYQTIYPEDTSVLNSMFTMMACCWIEKLHYKGWTQVTGDSKSTDLEIAEKLDQYLNSSMMNAFDGRFITVSKTYYTQTDEANGFSFTTDTTIYSTMTKHTASYKIIARRMSESL